MTLNQQRHQALADYLQDAYGYTQAITGHDSAFEAHTLADRLERFEDLKRNLDRIGNRFGVDTPQLTEPTSEADMVRQTVNAQSWVVSLSTCHDINCITGEAYETKRIKLGTMRVYAENHRSAALLTDLATDRTMLLQSEEDQLAVLGPDWTEGEYDISDEYAQYFQYAE